MRLGETERKNGWTIAEYSGAPEPKALQRLLHLSPWDADEARDLVRGYAIEHFADPHGMVIADPSGFAEKGNKPAGVLAHFAGEQPTVVLGPESRGCLLGPLVALNLAEFVTVTLFESWDAVHEFAGDAHQTAIVSAPARQVLGDIDENVRHFAVVLAPGHGRGSSTGRP